MNLNALEVVSAIPFLLSGKKSLTPQEWCFILSFDWGLPYGITPTMAQKLLRIVLNEGFLEEENGSLRMTREFRVPALLFHGKKIDFSGLRDVEPYPLSFKIEVNREEIRPLAQKELQTRKANAEHDKPPSKTERTKKTKKKDEEKREDEKFRQTTLF